MEFIVKVPGSCGELVQGTIKGVPFLITCPINLYTMVKVSDKDLSYSGLGVKSKLALERTLKYFGKTKFPYGIMLNSELPIGKGMASSSADIAAVCVAVATAFDISMSAEEISRLAAGIEPTDGIFFQDIVRMNQMTGECLEKFTFFPRIKIAIFDTGGFIDTIRFHEREDLDILTKKNETAIAKALDILRNSNEPAKIAEVTTKSAFLNQSILPKKHLREIFNFAKAEGAIGINVAHSGTVLGVLFSPVTKLNFIYEKARKFAYQFPHLQYLQCVELISGGYEIERIE